MPPAALFARLAEAGSCPGQEGSEGRGLLPCKHHEAGQPSPGAGSDTQGLLTDMWEGLCSQLVCVLEDMGPWSTSQAEWPGVAWGAESPGPGPRAAGGRSCGLAMQVASAKSSGKPGLNPGSAFYQMCDPGHSTHLLPSKPAFCSTVPAPWAQGALEETTGKGQQPLVLVGAPDPRFLPCGAPGLRL